MAYLDTVGNVNNAAFSRKGVDAGVAISRGTTVVYEEAGESRCNIGVQQRQALSRECRVGTTVGEDDKAVRFRPLICTAVEF